MTEATARSQLTKRRILDVAARRFREQGYAAVSLRSIAKAANMQAGSLYYHFASKEDLVCEILNQGIDAVHEEVRRSVEAVAGSQRSVIFRAAIRAHLKSLLRQSDYTSANVRIFGQVPEAVRKRCLATRRAYEEFWDKLLSGLRDDGALQSKADVRAARLLILGALNASLDWFDPKRGGVEALADQYADLIWNGFDGMSKQ